MPQEQERAKETPVEFQRVPSETVSRILDLFSLEAAEESRAFKLPDPISMCVLALTNNSRLNTSFRNRMISGASFMCFCFEDCEKNWGTKISAVSKEIAETFLRETLPDQNLFSPKPVRELSPQEAKVVFGAQRPEFNWPTPEDYEGENPFVMGTIKFSDPAFGMGILLAYELYKRQFHADQLAKQFGG